MDTNKDHMRHCILFMLILCKKASQAKDKIYQKYGTDSVGLTTIKEWYAKFKKGEFNLEDQPRSGRPKEMEDEELLVKLWTNQAR